MKLLEIVERALNAEREDLEDEPTEVLRFIHGFAEHHLAGMAGAILFDRESENLPEGQYPRGFVRQRDFERSLEPIAEREQFKRERPVWKSKAEMKRKQAELF